jgi:uncharacterized protein (TIGR02246 family)
MAPDERALTDLVRQLEDAWNTADPAAFAAPFRDDAVFIHLYGGQLDGRAAIEDTHRVIFGGIYQGSRNHWTVRGIRFFRPDVAIVLAEAHLQFSEHGQPREIQARPTLIVVKEEGRWGIQMFQNTRVTDPPSGIRP